MPDLPFLTTADTAARIGLSYMAFVTTRQRLVDELGFPEPLPHSLRPLLWRRDQVEAWLARQGLPKPAPVPRPSGVNVHLLEEARRA